MLHADGCTQRPSFLNLPRATGQRGGDAFRPPVTVRGPGVSVVVPQMQHHTGRRQQGAAIEGDRPNTLRTKLQRDGCWLSGSKKPSGRKWYPGWQAVAPGHQDGGRTARGNFGGKQQARDAEHRIGLNLLERNRRTVRRGQEPVLAEVVVDPGFTLDQSRRTMRRRR